MTAGDKWEADEEQARILGGASGAQLSKQTRFDGNGSTMSQRPKGGVVAHHAARQVGKQGRAKAKGFEDL